MSTLYCAILKLSPAEYQVAFGPEMTEIFEQTCATHKQHGPIAALRFALREYLGLFKGAIVEHAAKWTAPDTYISARCIPHAATADAPDEIVELERHLQQLIRSMESAIAHHDFPKARFYSSEERIARARLQQLQAIRTRRALNNCQPRQAL